MNIVLFDAEELTEATPGTPAVAPTPPRPAAPRDPSQPDVRAVRLPAADRRARHIIDVLRLGPGDSFRAGVVDGVACTGRVVSVEADGSVTVSLERAGTTEAVAANPGSAAAPGAASIGAAAPANPGAAARPLHPVRLLLGHPRPIVLRRLLRDLSTLGIEQLVVVRTELGEKSYLESKLWQGDDVRRLLIEGAEQAGSTLLPRVEKAWRLADAIGQVVEGREGAPRVVFDNAVSGEGAASRGFHPPAAAGGGGASAARAAAGAGRVIAVGSERGWTDGERDLLRENGFETVLLGERILRTETAAIA
ncbi:MAG: RsmE family RNA methyltransferase, partial [Spirochaetia bacterium]